MGSCIIQRPQSINGCGVQKNMHELQTVGKQPELITVVAERYCKSIHEVNRKT